MRIFFLLLTLSNVSLASIGMVMISRGKGEIIQNKKSTEIKVGLKINEGDTIRTDSSSHVKLVMDDRNIIVVTENTELTLTQYTPNKNVHIDLKTGSLRHVVEQKYDGIKNKYEVKIPVAVIGVRGTDFISEFDSTTGDSVLCTLKGAAAFTADQSKTSVIAKKGEFIRFKKGEIEAKVIEVKKPWLEKALIKHTLD